MSESTGLLCENLNLDQFLSNFSKDVFHRGTVSTPNPCRVVLVDTLGVTYNSNSVLAMADTCMRNT
jgi:hypothetical protein